MVVKNKMKQSINLSIEENILEKIKENVPNVSQFVEDCFIAYLTFMTENDEERGEELRKQWENFHRAKVNIHLLMNVTYENNAIEKAQEEKQTMAWLGAWKYYRHSQSCPQPTKEEACKILKINERELDELMEDCLIASKKNPGEKYLFDNWKYVKENYLPNIDVDDDLEDELNDLFG